MGGAMFLNFTSDSSLESTGFIASYGPPTTSTAQAAGPCPNGGLSLLAASQGLLTDNTDAFALYPADTTCQWLIAPANANLPITLAFTRMDVEDTYDYIRVYDGDTTDPARLLGVWSGTEFTSDGTSLTQVALPSVRSAVSTAGKMLVTFTSDSSLQGSGFAASYSQ